MIWSFYMKAMEKKFECFRIGISSGKCEEALKLFDKAEIINIKEF